MTKTILASCLSLFTLAAAAENHNELAEEYILPSVITTKATTLTHAVCLDHIDNITGFETLTGKPADCRIIGSYCDCYVESKRNDIEETEINVVDIRFKDGKSYADVIQYTD